MLNIAFIRGWYTQEVGKTENESDNVVGIESLLKQLVETIVKQTKSREKFKNIHDSFECT